MRRILIAAILLWAPAAFAQQPVDPAMLAAQLSVASQMLDQQKTQIIQLGAQVILLQQENAKLKAEASKPAPKTGDGK